jgi:hypothetical protein
MTRMPVWRCLASRKLLAGPCCLLLFDERNNAECSGGVFDHVICCLAGGTLSQTQPTQTPVHKVETIFSEEFYPSYRVAAALLPPIKDREGASFTIVSGGLAHGVLFPAAWTATMKNSLMNTFALTLAAETRDCAVRSVSVPPVV